MAVYKVPQDVEAEDKLIGPFSFKQFIYLIIAAMGIALGWGLAQLFAPLAIIPAPIVIFFTALALPLRKDQPTDVYLAALVSFLVKPRKRIWKPDGITSFVEIVEPNVVDKVRVKGMSHEETEKRLEYLANLVDSGGWAVRGVGAPTSNTSLQEDVYFESQQVEDTLEDGAVSQSFEAMLDEASAKRRQNIESMMSQPASAATIPPTPDPYAALSSPGLAQTTTGNQEAIEPDTQLKYSPYPEAMRQSVINPGAAASAPDPVTSQPTTSPDIINLANNPDLSIETIAHEAQRLREKEQQKLLDKEEVVISLR